MLEQTGDRRALEDTLSNAAWSELRKTQYEYGEKMKKMRKIGDAEIPYPASRQRYFSNNNWNMDILVDMDNQTVKEQGGGST